MKAEKKIEILIITHGCHERGVYPDGWTGDEPLASDPFEDGGQLNLFSDLDEEP